MKIVAAPGLCERRYDIKMVFRKFHEAACASGGSTINDMLAKNVAARGAAGTVLVCSLALLAGCAADSEEMAARRAVDEVSTLASMPVAGCELCLAGGPGHSPLLDVAVRRALSDRGFRVRLVEAAGGEPPQGCRSLVTVSAEPGRNPGELPGEIALEFNDALSGEAKRAVWRDGWHRTGTPGRVRADASSDAQAESLEAGLLMGPYGDPDRIVRELVERLFPKPEEGKR